MAFRPFSHRQKEFPAPPSRTRCSQGCALSLLAFGLLLTYGFMQHPVPRFAPPPNEPSALRRGPVAAPVHLTAQHSAKNDRAKQIAEWEQAVLDGLEPERVVPVEDASEGSAGSEKAAVQVEDALSSKADGDASEKVASDEDVGAGKGGPTSEKAVRGDAKAQTDDADTGTKKTVRDEAAAADNEAKDGPALEGANSALADRQREVDNVSSEKAVRQDTSKAQTDDADTGTKKTVRDEAAEAGDEDAAPKKTAREDTDSAEAGVNVAEPKSTSSDSMGTRDSAIAAKPFKVGEEEPVTEFRRNELPNKTSPTGDLSCFLYDRPPNTGSTTMGRALRECLADRLNFKEPGHWELQDSTNLVMKMMAVIEGPRRMLVSEHLRLSHVDLAMIRKRCRHLLYVTSCQPIRERMWSRQKHRFKPGNVSSTLTKEDHEKAIKGLVKDLPQNESEEPFLEGHPYLDKGEKWTDVSEEEKLVPDYVVRNDPEGHYGEDLRALLTALGCEGEFKTTNMHLSEHDSDGVFLLIELNLGDTIYRKLKIHGDRVNEDG